MDNYNETVEYYNKNAETFIESTINVDATSLYKPFMEVVPKGSRILDLGCGSGRDSAYFKSQGYDVVALDPSKAMCEHTAKIAGVPVYNIYAEDMIFENEFEGLWACASLLHIPVDKQKIVMLLIAKALKDNGIAYCSWKYGDGVRSVDGRTFTDYNEEKFNKLLQEVSMFKEEKLWITQDVRGDRPEQKWLNVLVRKVGKVE